MRRLDLLDRWLVVLRAVALAVGAAWGMAYPLETAARTHLVWLLAAFATYSAVLYAVGLRHPLRLASLYRAAMILDLVFIVALVRITGGMASNFYLAFYLLIALHAVYFGLATGILAAALSAVLYGGVAGWPPAIHLGDLGLRIGFFLLVGVCMGGLAERERRKRATIERLNAELQAQQQHLREAQERLSRSDRLATMGELTAGLAHELKTPLAGIGGALHVLANQLPDHDPRQAILAEIQEQIARMNRTLADLLQQARPAAPQYRLLGVNEVVAQSLWLLPTGDSTGIETVTDLRPDLPPLWLDPTLVHQALLNILVNARQAMAAGGRLTVGTGLENHAAHGGPSVEISIADTGPGIPPAHLDRIFQPFFTTKAQGTGLGLAIASRIIQQHGGCIAVESTPGHGARFRIRLPVLRERQDAHGIPTPRG